MSGEGLLKKWGSLSTRANRIMVQDLFISGFLSTNLLKIIISVFSGAAKTPLQQSRASKTFSARRAAGINTSLTQICCCLNLNYI